MDKEAGGGTPQQKIAFLRSARQVRRFRPDPMPDDVLHDIVEVARWSGSASNQQPWDLVLVRRRETLQALARAEGYAGHLAGAAAGLVLVMAGQDAETETFDEGRLSERIILAAKAHGVGGGIGWIRGGGQDTVKRLLGIRRPLIRTLIALGYPADAPPPDPAPAASPSPPSSMRSTSNLKIDDGRRTTDDGRRTMDDGRWTMDDGRLANDKVIRQSQFLNPEP